MINNDHRQSGIEHLFVVLNIGGTNHESNVVPMNYSQASLLVCLSDSLNDKERISHPRVGRNILARRRLEQPRVVKEAASDENVLQIIGLQPYLECLGGEAVIKEEMRDARY